MPTTNKAGAGKSKATAGKASGNAKKQAPVNVKTTSARDKAKNFDEGRRNDANSNEL